MIYVESEGIVGGNTWQKYEFQSQFDLDRYIGFVIYWLVGLVLYKVGLEVYKGI